MLTWPRWRSNMAVNSSLRTAISRVSRDCAGGIHWARKRRHHCGQRALIETVRQRDTLWTGGSTNVSWTSKAVSKRVFHEPHDPCCCMFHLVQVIRHAVGVDNTGKLVEVSLAADGRDENVVQRQYELRRMA